MHQNNQFCPSSRLLRVSLMGGQARVFLCDTTAMVREARTLHDASRVCTAAMGRMVSLGAIMGAQLKGERESVTVSIRGGGPAGALTAVAGNGRVKVTLGDPALELPLRADGMLDVGGALGREGRFSVVRDLGFGQPYVGQVALVSGEVAQDAAMYYAVSEQTPALCALGVHIDPEGAVLSAGGVLIQALPDCGEALISALEVRSALFDGISQTLQEQTLEQVVEAFFRGLEPEILEEVPLVLRCDCSRERIEKALVALGAEELTDMIRQQDGAQIQCHFCNKRYAFDRGQLERLLGAAGSCGTIQ